LVCAGRHQERVADDGGAGIGGERPLIASSSSWSGRAGRVDRDQARAVDVGCAAGFDRSEVVM
jgi:hypothetical protein